VRSNLDLPAGERNRIACSSKPVVHNFAPVADRPGETQEKTLAVAKLIP
jgi:hypothetical protein